VNSAFVGDSPRGPLKPTGESPLKTHDEPKLSASHLNTQGRAHAAVASTAHQDGPLKDPLEQAPPRSRAHASPRAGSASLEGARLPSSRLRLARGRTPPPSGLRPVRGGALTSSRLRLARGPAPPSSGLRLARGRPARARLFPYAGIKCLDNGGAAPSCTWGSRPGAVAPTPQEGTHPRHCGRLCGVAGAGPVTPRRLLRYG
jgi:hypothetical protein